LFSWIEIVFIDGISILGDHLILTLKIFEGLKGFGKGLFVMTQGFGERLEPPKNLKNLNLPYFRGKQCP
jgi:hypothetical protein